MVEVDSIPDQQLSEVALAVGTNLLGDQFTITSRLRAGGFGITYRALDNFLGRTVVIKECFADDFCLRSGTNVIARSQTYEKPFRSIVEMFIHEARSLAKLRHPNIVGVHRAFEENGTAYMALDLISGHDLDNILAVNAATLPPIGVKDMLLRLLDAIETIHDQDLLHRDISPDNIMIENDGNPVLIDFGAARGDASRRTRAVSSLLVVKDGYSPQEFYMAGSIQTPSSDLYALAATFYHVLSGEAPPNSQVRMVEVAGQNPDPCVPLEGRIDGYEPIFLKAIDAAMQPLPRNRLQSADQWIEMITGPATPRPKSIAKIVPPELCADVDKKPTDVELALSLSQLVEETNEEVRKTRLVVVDPPKGTVAAPQTAPTPEWLDEFNQDTLSEDQTDTDEAQFDALSDLFEEDDETQTARQPLPVIAETTAAPSPNESNWINRVREKQSGPDRGLERRAQATATLSQPAETDVPNSLTRSAAQISVEGGETQSMAAMIGPLLKYLSIGIAIGLGLMLLYFAI